MKKINFVLDTFGICAGFACFIYWMISSDVAYLAMACVLFLQARVNMVDKRISLFREHLEILNKRQAQVEECVTQVMQVLTKGVIKTLPITRGSSDRN